MTQGPAGRALGPTHRAKKRAARVAPPWMAEKGDPRKPKLCESGLPEVRNERRDGGNGVGPPDELLFNFDRQRRWFPLA